MNRWVYIILLLLCSSVFAFGQTRNDTDLSLSDNTLTVAERNAQLGFNDTIDRLAEDFIEAYVVIADPSHTIYSTLGHACIRLKCKSFDKDYMFSYESENVEEKILSFLWGDLKMGMFRVSPAEYIDFYKQSNRGVRQYRLNLSPVSKMCLWEILEKEEMKGAYLPYDYLERGCAQSIMQFVIKAVSPQKIQYAPWSDKFKQTRREFVASNLDNYPWANCWFYLAVGIEADKKVTNIEKVVIPTDLIEVLQKAEINGTKVLADSAQILVEGSPVKPYSGITPLVVALFITLLMLVSVFVPSKYGKVIDWIMLGIITTLGVFLTYILLVSHLPNTSWIWLIVPFNLVPAILWKWRKYWSWVYIGILLVWMIGIVTYPHVLVHNAYIILTFGEMILLFKQTDICEKFRKIIKIDKL